ncbi:MAG: hypothetical protein RIC55_24985 [Pirellulaceae bacterium]
MTNEQFLHIMRQQLQAGTKNVMTETTQRTAPRSSQQLIAGESADVAERPTYYFIISAGRTATVFLSRELSRLYPHLCCWHEPPPARFELMLANLRNDWSLGRGTLERWFLRTRRRRMASLARGRQYVEVNPMLCPLADLLPELPGRVRVIHLVRHAESWAQSILKFKASGFRRHVIDYLPMATPFPSPRPSGWRRLPASAKALWRWRHCNEQIAALATRCDHYTRLRFEDLMSDDDQACRAAATAFLTGLDIPDLGPSDLDAWRRLVSRPKQNAAPDGEMPHIDAPLVQQICGDLLAQYGYA